MNPQLRYYLAQAQTADLLRQAQGHRQRLAAATDPRSRRPQTAIRRIIDGVRRAGNAKIPTASVHHGA
jgi:hypothetical protein